MKAKPFVSVICILFSIVLGPAMAAEPIGLPPLKPVASVDLTRYMGKWYEISKFPNWFQKKCVGYTSAEYSIRPDGDVQVINRCRLENGETSEAIGLARQKGDPKSPRLEVRFAPAWLSFFPGVWGDYWIIDLDLDYRLVAVSEPKREYLWVLSRDPHVEPKAYDALLQRLSDQGFDIGKLEPAKQ